MTRTTVHPRNNVCIRKPTSWSKTAEVSCKLYLFVFQLYLKYNGFLFNYRIYVDQKSEISFIIKLRKLREPSYGCSWYVVLTMVTALYFTVILVDSGQN